MINRALQTLFIITTIILKTISTFCVYAQHILCLPLTPHVLGVKTLHKDSKIEFIHGDMVHLL